MVREPDHILLAKKVAISIFSYGRGIGFEISGRIDQELEDQRGAALVTRHLGNDGREVATRAISTYRNAGRVAVQLSGVPGYPAGGGVAIFRRGGKFVFGWREVAPGGDETGGLGCGGPGDVVVG